MRIVSKSLGANMLSSIPASSKYPIGISLRGMTINSVPANDPEHDTGVTAVAGFRYDVDADTADFNDWCCIIGAIQSQLNDATARHEPALLSNPGKISPGNSR
jgi:hypothetical protein